MELARPRPDPDRLDRTGIDRNDDDVARGLTRKLVGPQVGEGVFQRIGDPGQQDCRERAHHKKMRSILSHVPHPPTCAVLKDGGTPWAAPTTEPSRQRLVMACGRVGSRAGLW